LIDKTPSMHSVRHKQAAAWASPAMGEPCSFCGVRPDVTCAHREGVGSPPPAIVNAGKPPKRDGRSHAIPGGGRYTISREAILRARGLA
jgi:hypothetical protein